MKRVIYIVVTALAVGNLSAATKWNSIDKTMSAWNVNDGSTYNQAWTLSKSGNGSSQFPPIATQEAGYVNIQKTYTWYGNNYGFLTSPTLSVQPLTTYSIEIKARLQAIDKLTFPDMTPPSTSGTEGGFESNQLSARLNAKNLAIHLKYGDEKTGLISTRASLIPENREGGGVYSTSTSEWHIYQFVLHSNNSSFDFYLDNQPDPIFENVPTSSMSGSNILRLGAETQHRCNMDIEYVKMGTGDLFSRSKFLSTTLSDKSQSAHSDKTITVSTESLLIRDNQTILISLVDEKDGIVVRAIEATVIGNKAEANITIPAGLKQGKYFVKVAVPNGEIEGNSVKPQLTEYRITSSAFEGKNIVAFGNSITAATNSWADQTNEILRFGSYYNGAYAGACWYRRARLAQDGDSIWTQDYADPHFSGFSNGSNTNREVFQKIINNCAVIHIQKYLAERTSAPDYIILSYGTNDVESESTMGDADQVLNEANLSDVNQYTMTGALRWCLQTLQNNFPHATIYVALPLQARSDNKNNGNLKKMVKIKAICDGLSILYFDCYNESGITKANEASTLRDGLHPNATGQAIHADYIIKKMEEAASNPSSNNKMKEEHKQVIISGNHLNIGQTITIKCTANAPTLSEITLSDIAGTERYHKLISGSEFTFQAPSTSGLYLMRIRLSNNVSDTYKIIVK